MSTEKLVALLGVTERMLEQALQDSWSELEVLWQEQDQLVKEVVVGVDSWNASEIALLQRIKVLSDQTVLLAEQHKAEIAEELRAFMHGKQGQKAYAQKLE